MTRLEDFAKKMFGPTDDIFTDQQNIQPMWFLSDEGGALTVVCTPWENDQEKEASIAYVKQLMKERHTVVYASIAEVWTLEADKDKGLPESVKLGSSIASHPDRREAIVMIAQDKSGDCICLTKYILRPEHGKATLSEMRIQKFNNSSIEGRMANLLVD